MDDASTIGPLEVARRPDLLLVDIRPVAERRSELGFLPASVSLPLVDVAEDDAVEALAALQRRGGVVLHCTSGRRSAQARASLADRASFPILHLEGGQLAWAAAGLPVCRAVDQPAERVASVLEFRRYLVACFVAENAEIALEQDRTSIEPYSMLQACFQAAGASWDEPTIEDCYRALDWAGVSTFRAGGGLAQIAENLSAMVAVLAAIEPSQTSSR